MSLDHETAFVKYQTDTKDAFLGGKLHLWQPANGFRAGLDSVLLSAAISSQTATILDLGAGVGTASLCALAHNPVRFATLVEKNADMCAYAERNIADNDFAAHATIITADVAAGGKAREAAGIRRDFYQSVIANPPFFDAAGGTNAPDADRASARHMDDSELSNWVKTAAAAAAPRGEVIFIYPAQGLSVLLAAFGTRFGAVTILPLVSRPDGDALRVLVRGIKGSRAPMVLKSPFAMHGSEGREFAPKADDIFRGREVLHW